MVRLARFLSRIPSPHPPQPDRRVVPDTRAPRVAIARTISRGARVTRAPRPTRLDALRVPDPSSDTAPSHAPNAEPCRAQGFPRVCGPRAVSRARGGGRGGPGEEQSGGPRAFPAGVRGGRAAARRRPSRGGSTRGGEPRGLVAPPRARARVARARPHPPGRPSSFGVAAGVLERRASLPRNSPSRRGAPRVPRVPHRARARRRVAVQTQRLRVCAAHVPADVHAALQPAHVLVRMARLRAEKSRAERRRRATRDGAGGVRGRAKRRRRVGRRGRAVRARARRARAAAAARRTTRRTSAWCP